MTRSREETSLWEAEVRQREVGPARTIFIWGLKRSGIHLFVNWLYANLDATTKDTLDTQGLHPQLCDGFRDAAAGVAFYNNCGRHHSR